MTKKANQETENEGLISDAGVDQSAAISDDGLITDNGLITDDGLITDTGLITDDGLIADEPVADIPTVVAAAPSPAPTPAPTPALTVGPMTVVDGGASGSVKTARFSPLGQGSPVQAQGSMDLLLDVNLNLSVELGRTSMPVREVLHLGPGSIVELDKLAGEPVDIMVNGKLVARGEVVVVDENFGVRVTDIASQNERLSKLG